MVTTMPGYYTPQYRYGTHCTGVRVGLMAGLAPPGLNLWTDHSKASRYTNCAILANVCRRYPLHILAICPVFLNDKILGFCGCKYHDDSLQGVKQCSLIITSGSEDLAASISRFEDFFKSCCLFTELHGIMSRNTMIFFPPLCGFSLDC